MKLLPARLKPITRIFLQLLACSFVALPAKSAALHPGASIYKWNKASPMPGIASHNFTVRGGTATVREGGEIIMVGRAPALDLPGTTDVHIEIDPRTKQTLYAGLVFKEPCVLSILSDGTLVAGDSKNPWAYDLTGKYWMLTKHAAGGKQRWVFSDDLSELIQNFNATGHKVMNKAQQPGLMGFTLHGDAIWIWNAYQAGMTRAGVSPSQGMMRTETVAKNCGRCGKAVNLSAKVGQNCPHCGAYWGALDSSFLPGKDTSLPPKPGMQSCFIATAAFGSPLEPHVVSLRDFRDRWLLTNSPGRWLVFIYYQYSPPVAAVISERPWLRSITRIMLAPLVVIARALQGSPQDIALLLIFGWVVNTCSRKFLVRWRNSKSTSAALL